jgi:hypothetical protein
MKKPSARLAVVPQPSEQEISDYAFHLYQQSNCEPGRDLDNWHEATAALMANLPRVHSAASNA